MKEKSMRMYLVFWSDELRNTKYESNSGFSTARTGDTYLIIADTVMTSNDYIDFQTIEKAFLKKCAENESLISDLMHLDGFFNIEIVPRFTKSSVPAIVFEKEFIDFLNTITQKLNIIEIDMYVS